VHVFHQGIFQGLRHHPAPPYLRSISVYTPAGATAFTRTLIKLNLLQKKQRIW
jgi:hypothetical protein